MRKLSTVEIFNISISHCDLAVHSITTTTDNDFNNLGGPTTQHWLKILSKQYLPWYRIYFLSRHVSVLMNHHQVILFTKAYDVLNYMLLTRPCVCILIYIFIKHSLLSTVNSFKNRYLQLVLSLVI
jgi:hypothetical protein